MTDSVVSSTEFTEGASRDQHCIPLSIQAKNSDLDHNLELDPRGSKLPPRKEI